MKKRHYYPLINMRQEAGLTQLEFARLFEVSPRTVSRWETGETPIPAVKLARICRLLGRNELIAPLNAELRERDAAPPPADDENPQTCPDLWAESKGYPGWPATAPYEPQQRWLRANWLRLKAWFGAEYPPAVLVEQVLCVGAQGVVPPEFGAYSAAMYACALDLEQGLDPDGALAAGAGSDLC